MKGQIDNLRAIFERNQDSEFVVDVQSGISLTYREIGECSLKFATVLNEKGISKNDTVGIILPNCLEYIITYFTLMNLGAVAVPINEDLDIDEKEFMLSNANVKLMIMASEENRELVEIIERHTCATLFIERNCESRNFVDTHFFQTINSRQPLSNGMFEYIDDEDLLAIMYSSGTTSRPKGIMIQAEHILNNGRTFIKAQKIDRNVRFLCVFSLSYMGGWYNLTLITLLAEGTIILDEVFNVNTTLKFWDNVMNHRVTSLWVSPTMMSMLLFTGIKPEAKEYCRKSIKAALVGTSPISPALKEDFEKFSSIYFRDSYGLTETTFIASDSSGSKQKASSIGRIIDGVEVEIRSEQGICPRGEEGEIVVKTKYLMKGYLNSEEHQGIGEDGFFSTGDIGYVDQDNYLYVTGRKKDLIIRGGLNISPKKIEDKLMQMQGVEEVTCIGLPHEIYGEEITAVLRIQDGFKDKLDERMVLAFAREHLSANVLPKNVYFMDAFPKSVTGKVQKDKLKLIILSARGLSVEGAVISSIVAQ